MIVIYADESRTHDPLGVQPHSQHPIIAGWAAKKSVWDKFEISWNAMLKKYDVQYYHGRQLTEAIIAKKTNKPPTKELLKNPYFVKKWSLVEIESFRKSMTRIAAMDSKIPIIGNVNIPVFNTLKGKISFQNPDIKLGNDPYKICMSDFFNVYHYETWLQWGNFKTGVQFVFAYVGKKWNRALGEVFDAYQKEDTRMMGIDIHNQSKHPLRPLEAADLLAHRAGQLAEDNMNGKLELSPLDNVLFQNLFKSARVKYPQIKPYLK